MDLTSHPTVRKAVFYEKLPEDKVRCTLCERKCEIPPNFKGFCKTRINIKANYTR